MPNNGILRKLAFLTDDIAVPARTVRRRSHGSSTEDDIDASSLVSESEHEAEPKPRPKRKQLTKNRNVESAESRLFRVLSKRRHGAPILPGVHLCLIGWEDTWDSYSSHSVSSGPQRAGEERQRRNPGQGIRITLDNAMDDVERRSSSGREIGTKDPLYTFDQIKDALQELRLLMVAVRPTSVDLVYRPGGETRLARKAQKTGKSKRPKDSEKSSDTLSLSSLLSDKTMRSLEDKCERFLPDRIPSAWKQVLGLAHRKDSKAEVAAIREQAKVLHEVLAICKPGRITIDLSLTNMPESEGQHVSRDSGDSDSDTTSIASLDGGSVSGSRSNRADRQESSLAKARLQMEDNLDADRIFVPMGITPFLLAGNKYYNSSVPAGAKAKTRPAVLPLLEIGPEIPISVETALKLPGLFAFGTWKPETLVLHYWARAEIPSEAKGQAKKDREKSKEDFGGEALPRLIWDSLYGVGELLKEGQQTSTRGSRGTEIVLVVRSSHHAEDFREEIEHLAGLREHKSLFHKSDRSGDGLAKRDPKAFAKLSRLKRHLSYIDTSPGGVAMGLMPLWDVPSDDGKDGEIECTCKTAHMSRRKAVKASNGRGAPNQNEREKNEEASSSTSESDSEADGQGRRRWFGWRKGKSAPRTQRD